MATFVPINGSIVLGECSFCKGSTSYVIVFVRVAISRCTSEVRVDGTFAICWNNDGLCLNEVPIDWLLYLSASFSEEQLELGLLWCLRVLV